MGCIFVEIFGGPLPYAGINTLAELTREIVMNRRTPVVPGHIPGSMQQIIRSCLQFDHRLRPTSKSVLELSKKAKRLMRTQGLGAV